MPLAEYESIMIPYKRMMLAFERQLRQLADNNIISFSIVDKFTKEFNFAELQRLRFESAEDQDAFQQARPQQTAPSMPMSQFSQPAPQPQNAFSFGQQQAPSTSRGFGQAPVSPQSQPVASSFGATPQRQTAQRPGSFTFGQAQQPAPAPTSSFGFGKDNPASSPRPGTAPPPSGFGRQESSSLFGQGSSGLGSFSDLSKESTSPTTSFSPRTPPPAQPPSFGLSNDFGSQSKPQEGKISVGIDEEDRATGIAILRKKMLMELRKIRNVVEQEDDSSF